MLKCSERAKKCLNRVITGRLETIRQKRTVWKKNRELEKRTFIPGGFLKFISLFSLPTIVSIIVILINLGIK